MSRPLAGPSAGPQALAPVAAALLGNLSLRSLALVGNGFGAAGAAALAAVVRGLPPPVGKCRTGLGFEEASTKVAKCCEAYNVRVSTLCQTASWPVGTYSKWHFLPQTVAR